MIDISIPELEILFMVHFWFDKLFFDELTFRLEAIWPEVVKHKGFFSVQEKPILISFIIINSELMFQVLHDPA